MLHPVTESGPMSDNLPNGHSCYLDQFIFSSRDGYVWVSWRETDASVKLGRHEIVAAMMRDFLAQDDLGLRLSKHSLDGPSDLSGKH